MHDKSFASSPQFIHVAQKLGVVSDADQAITGVKLPAALVLCYVNESPFRWLVGNLLLT